MELMITKYIIKIWNPLIRQYIPTWEGSEKYAETMYNKSYNKRHTRRMIKITAEILYKDKKKNDKS